MREAFPMRAKEGGGVNQRKVVERKETVWKMWGVTSWRGWGGKNLRPNVSRRYVRKAGRASEQQVPVAGRREGEAGYL
jgi:hypothetical protein